MRLYPASLQELLLSIARIAAAFYLIVLAGMFLFQEHLIFFARQLPGDYKFAFAHPFEERLQTIGGLKIDSVLFKADQPKGLILYFHGNAGNLKDWGQVAENLSDHTHYSVLMVDYPGFGKSEGSITSEEQLHNIAKEIYRSAIEKMDGEDKIIVYGRSIGSGLAVKLASENRPQALILETPYLNLVSVAKAQYPWVPLFLMKYTFHSDAWIDQVKCPVLVLSGTEDEAIPHIQAIALAALAHDHTLIEIPGGHHNDLAQSPIFWPAIEKFFASAE
jgi:uncharacterized protein